MGTLLLSKTSVILIIIITVFLLANQVKSCCYLEPYVMIILIHIYAVCCYWLDLNCLSLEVQFISFLSQFGDYI